MLHHKSILSFLFRRRLEAQVLCNCKRYYDATSAYSLSKLANVLRTKKLVCKFRGKNDGGCFKYIPKNTKDEHRAQCTYLFLPGRWVFFSNFLKIGVIVLSGKFQSSESDELQNLIFCKAS